MGNSRGKIGFKRPAEATGQTVLFSKQYSLR